jgi:hypothetical protein
LKKRLISNSEMAIDSENTGALRYGGEHGRYKFLLSLVKVGPTAATISLHLIQAKEARLIELHSLMVEVIDAGEGPQMSFGMRRCRQVCPTNGSMQ